MRCWWFGLVLPLACSSSAPETTIGSVDQVVIDAWGGSEPVVLVVVVDDGAGSAALRNAFAADELTHEVMGLAGVGEASPVTWVAVDARAFVVHSSRPTEIAGPIVLQSVRATETDVRVFADALLAEVRKPSPTEVDNAILLGAFHAVLLLDGRHSPMGSDEARIVGSLPAIESSPVVTLVTAREDASPGTPESYALGHQSSGVRRFQWISVVGEGGAADRLKKWSRLSDANTQPPSQPPFYPELFPQGVVDGGCFQMRPVQIDPTGSAACKVTITSRILAWCDPLRGWSDPMVRGVATPKWIDSGLGPQRVCEVRQLEGDARDRCINLQDPGASGYCIDQRSLCGFPMRFAERAMPYSTGRVYVNVACDLQDQL